MKARARPKGHWISEKEYARLKKLSRGGRITKRAGSTIMVMILYYFAGMMWMQSHLAAAQAAGHLVEMPQWEKIVSTFFWGLLAIAEILSKMAG